MKMNNEKKRFYFYVEKLAPTHACLKICMILYKLLLISTNEIFVRMCVIGFFKKSIFAVFSKNPENFGL